MTKNFSFKKAEYLLSLMNPEQFPNFSDSRGKTLPEIVLVGRSNVGKSSLVNHLLMHKGLAKVSATPGKTQTVNFFKVDQELILVDLPGDGFAKAPKQLQMQWSSAIEGYFTTRPHVNLILLLLDIRREPSIEDKKLIEWAQYNQKQILLIFTKTDKLNTSECKRNSENILSQLGSNQFSYVFYTVKDMGSRDNLIKKINEKIS